MFPLLYILISETKAVSKSSQSSGAPVPNPTFILLHSALGLT